MVKLITKQEFLGKEFHAFCQQEYDKARYYLKHCGRDADRYMIQHHKLTAQVFGKLL